MSNETLNRFDRLIAIFIHLQSSRIVRARDLADRFGVSLRTIYRDIRSLETAGVPVSGEAGEGYSIMDGFHLPPVMFTREEAGSFVAAQKLMQKFGDKALGGYHESAMFKVKSVLRGSAKDRVSALESQIWINTSLTLFNENTPDALDILLEGMAEKKQVILTYQSLDSETPSERTIEPAGVFHENNYWYIKGYCHLRNDYRQFRTDRILKINRTEAPFIIDHAAQPERPKEFEEVSKLKVVIRVEKKLMKYLKTGRNYYGFKSEKVSDKHVEITFLISPNSDGLARWFLMFGDCAEILEPESFKQKVRDLIEKINTNLNKDQSSNSEQS